MLYPPVNPGPYLCPESIKRQSMTVFFTWQRAVPSGVSGPWLPCKSLNHNPKELIMAKKKAKKAAKKKK